MNNTDFIDYSSFLNRKSQIEEIKQFLTNYSDNNSSALYLYGDNGIGKTTFIQNLLKKLDYTIIYYDNIDNKNKSIENMYQNISSNNIMSLFYNKPKKNVILIDDIYTITFTEKNYFNNLIKILKNNKKTNTLNSPIICVNNTHNDKKISELIKCCINVKLDNPTDGELIDILNNLIPNLFKYSDNINKIIKKNILLFLNNRLNKINKIINYEKYNVILNKFYKNFNNMENDLYYNIKNSTLNLLTNYYTITDINNIGDCNRTTIGLLFHENIVKLFNKQDKDKVVNYYSKILDNFTYCDYIDRYIFINQIWQLNDVCYIIKIFYNNYLLYQYNLLNQKIRLDNIIFTKILTKYSSEYNNYQFFMSIYQLLNINKREIIILFYNLYQKYNLNISKDILNYYNINKLIYNRMIKYINNVLEYNII